MAKDDKSNKGKKTFDADKLNVIAEAEVGAKLIVRVYSYDGGAPKLAFLRRKKEGVRGDNRLSAEEAKALPDVIKKFVKAGAFDVEEDEDDDDSDEQTGEEG